MNAAHGWHWRITLADIEKIKANDRETVNRVYFDNLEKFRKMALKYCFKCRNYDFLEGFFDKEAETCALAERAFMTYLNGGCSLPIGVYAEILNEQEMKIQGLYYNRENNVYKKMSLTGNRFAPEELGIQLAMALKNICSTSL